MLKWKNQSRFSHDVHQMIHDHLYEKTRRITITRKQRVTREDYMGTKPEKRACCFQLINIWTRVRGMGKQYRWAPWREGSLTGEITKRATQTGSQTVKDLSNGIPHLILAHGIIAYIVITQVLELQRALKGKGISSRLCRIFRSQFFFLYAHIRTQNLGPGNP